MRVLRPRILLPLLVAALTLGWVTAAHGDRADQLIQILKTDLSYKVRLRVVVALGQLKQRRAVPSLIYALYDQNYTVRGLAAAALAQIGDKRALYALRRVAAKDTHGFVRTRAKIALRVLERAADPPGAPRAPPRRERFFIKIGKLANRTGRGERRSIQILEAALLKTFSAVPGVTTRIGDGSDPSAAVLSRHQLRGFALDGTLQRLGRERTGRGLRLTCSIRVALTTFPENSIKAIYSGETAMEVRFYQPRLEESLLKDLFEGAADEARRNIVTRYLSLQ